MERMKYYKCYLFVIILIVISFRDGVAVGDIPAIIAPWRPVEVPLNDENFGAENILEKWAYDESDADVLLMIALNLDGQMATDILISYIDAHHNVHGKGSANLGWARAIFCLGLVQTDDAKDYLLDLWNEYDRGIGDGSIQIKPRLLLSLNPLSPITDAMHFYLFDEKVKEAFLNSIFEIDGIKQAPGDDFISTSLRITARSQMAKSFVRWDIIEAPGGPPFIEPLYINRGFIINPVLPRDVSESHGRLVKWIGKLTDIECGSTREEWLIAAGNVWQNSLNDLVWALDEEYILKLYDDYLREDAPARIENKTITVRLWMFVLGNYLTKVTHDPENSLASPEIIESLTDAAEYLCTCEDGYVSEIGIKMIYTISLYMRGREDQQVAEWRGKVGGIADQRLEENERRGIESRVDLFLQRYRRE